MLFQCELMQGMLMENVVVCSQRSVAAGSLIPNEHGDSMVAGVSALQMQIWLLQWLLRRRATQWLPQVLTMTLNSGWSVGCKLC